MQHFGLALVAALLLVAVKGHVVSDEEMKGAMKNMDANKDGKVTVDELLKGMAGSAHVSEEAQEGLKKAQEKARDVFPMADANGDGFLEGDEVKKLMVAFLDDREL